MPLLLHSQEGPQDGSCSTVFDRRCRGCAHKNAQLPAVRVQPSQSVLLEVEHLNDTVSHKEYHTLSSTLRQGSPLYSLRLSTSQNIG